MLAAGAALVAAASLAPVPGRATPPGLGARLGLASTAFAAGWVHLLLAPEHWGESAILGVGFLGAGLLQLALAIAIVARPTLPAHFALVVLNVALVVIWLYAVFVGLPLGEVHDHTAGGWVVGAGEPITPAAAVAKAAEIAGALWAGAMACRAAPADAAVRRSPDRLGAAAR
ncbi:hypothetical protein [Sinomonas sp. P47F7]|uniref:hypothetical protein n=1 Tax=Sinomonas sp. P47F7 TaxID=3410987 RepID=UPI003BF4769C